MWVWLSMAVLGLGLVYLVSNYLRPKQLKVADYRHQWRALSKYLGHPQNHPLAVIEADKLLDRALKAARYPGETMAERLVAAGKVFSNKQSVWTAHKLRNQLVHEAFKARPIQVKRALQAYQRALKDLGAL